MEIMRNIDAQMMWWLGNLLALNLEYPILAKTMIWTSWITSKRRTKGLRSPFPVGSH